MSWKLVIHNGVPCLQCTSKNGAFVRLVQANKSSDVWSVWRHCGKSFQVDWCDTLEEAMERGRQFLKESP